MVKEGKIEKPKEEILWEDSHGIKEPKDFVLGCIEMILERRKEGETWKQPAELNKIVDYWHYFDKDTQDLIMSAIPEVAPYLLKTKLSELRKEEE